MVCKGITFLTTGMPGHMDRCAQRPSPAFVLCCAIPRLSKRMDGEADAGYTTAMKVRVLAMGITCLALLCAACTANVPASPTVAPSPTETAGAGQSPAPTPSPTRTVGASRSPAPTPSPTQTAGAGLTPAPTPSPMAGQSPTPTTPIPTPSRAPEVRVYEQAMTVLAYPFAAHLSAAPDPVYGGAVVRLNRAEYEASRPSPAPQTYRALIVENEYLRLAFLPELGGRLYQCAYKPTGQALFYNNRVLKPTYWGPLPRDENWWLAAGGLEWAFPVHEHGYEWGAPWDTATQRQGDGVAIVLRRTSGDLQAEVTVTLAAGEGRFTVTPRLTNIGACPLPVQFWANAMLAPGGATVGPDVRLIFPAAQVIVHSTGDAALPREGETLSWPLAGGRDLSRYAEWRNWLGVFATDPLPAFVGVYDTRADLGVARVLSGIGGAKLFGFGADFPDLATFADDGSSYVELWAGANRSFWPADDRLLAPGESLEWSETWIPIAGLGGFAAATREAVVRVEREGGRVMVAAYSPVERQATLRVTAAGESVLSEQVALGPGRPWVRQLPPGQGPFHLRLYADGGILLAEAACP